MNSHRALSAAALQIAAPIQLSFRTNPTSGWWGFISASSNKTSGCYWPNKRPVSGGCIENNGDICFCPKAKIE